ncbi:MAG: hypothetical protein ACR2IT_03210 [Pirellulales bacterium]
MRPPAFTCTRLPAVAVTPPVTTPSIVSVWRARVSLPADRPPTSSVPLPDTVIVCDPVSAPSPASTSVPLMTRVSPVKVLAALASVVVPPPNTRRPPVPPMPEPVTTKADVRLAKATPMGRTVEPIDTVVVTAESSKATSSPSR